MKNGLGKSLTKRNRSCSCQTTIATPGKGTWFNLQGLVKDSSLLPILGLLWAQGAWLHGLLELLVQKIQNKVVNWKGRLLLQRCRLILIRHVLSCMLIHTHAEVFASRLVIKLILWFLLSSGVRLMGKLKENGVRGRNYASRWGNEVSVSESWVRFRRLSSWNLLGIFWQLITCGLNSLEPNILKPVICALPI